jgi:Ran GTPase-activating protein (RanGAP) involved in mRNA processing and transport
MRALSLLNLASNNLRAEGTKLLAAALKGNQVMTELNISSNRRDISGVVALADVIPDMGALLVLSLKSNNLGAAGGKALAEGLKGNQVITELNIADNNLANSGYDMSGVIALADVIPGMGAMTKFDISSSDIRAEGGKALAAGLKGNQVITELNIANSNLTRGVRLDRNVDIFGTDMSGVVALADVIPDMGALIKLDISSNSIGDKQGGDLQRICVASSIELAK